MTTRPEDGTAGPNATALLESAGFDPDRNVLTRRQAEVFALREHGVAQAEIADRLGTSRANIAGIEASARENVAKAKETIAFLESIHAPVRVQIPAGTDVFDIPSVVYREADAAGVKVGASATELVQACNRAVVEAIDGRELTHPITVSVGPDGEVQLRTPPAESN